MRRAKRNQARQDAAVREMEAIDKANTERRKATTEEQRTTIDQERADALKANYEAQARAAYQAQATAWANANTRKKELDEAVRNNKSKAEIVRGTLPSTKPR
jgi:hypothetical protein